MADLKPISQFATASSVEANTLLFVSTPNQNNGYDSEKVSASELGEALVNDFEYTQDLSTVSKKVTGAINENKSVIGYSYDEYDATTAYSTGDLCIYNNVLYKALQSTTGNLPTNTTYWAQTSIADEIGRIDTALSDITTQYSVTASWNTTKINSGAIGAYKMNKLLFVSCYFRSNNGVSINETIGNISGISLKAAIFGSLYGSGGHSLRFKIESNGDVIVETALPANEWFSFSGIGFLI